MSRKTHSWVDEKSATSFFENCDRSLSSRALFHRSASARHCGQRAPAQQAYRLGQRVVVLEVDTEVETSAVQPLVPVDLAELLEVLGRVGLLAKVLEEVLAPLLSRDRRVGERLDVVLHVGDEDVEAAEGALEVEKEVGALGSAAVSSIAPCASRPLTFS